MNDYLYIVVSQMRQLMPVNGTTLLKILPSNISSNLTLNYPTGEDLKITVELFKMVDNRFLEDRIGLARDQIDENVLQECVGITSRSQNA